MVRLVVDAVGIQQRLRLRPGIPACAVRVTVYKKLHLAWQRPPNPGHQGVARKLTPQDLTRGVAQRPVDKLRGIYQGPVEVKECGGQLHARYSGRRREAFSRTRSSKFQVSSSRMLAVSVNSRCTGVTLISAFSMAAKSVPSSRWCFGGLL